MSLKRRVMAVAAVATLACGPLPGQDASAARRIRSALPEAQAGRVLEMIGAADRAGLPSGVLEQLALQGVIKGIAPATLIRALEQEAARLGQARTALGQDGRVVSEAELRAAADALRRGVPADVVGQLARQAPQQRALTVPVFVLGSLADRGVPSSAALAMVSERLSEGADDREIEQLPAFAARLFAQGLAVDEVTRILLTARYGLEGNAVPRNPGVRVQRVVVPGVEHH